MPKAEQVPIAPSQSGASSPAGLSCLTRDQRKAARVWIDAMVADGFAFVAAPPATDVSNFRIRRGQQDEFSHKALISLVK